MSLTTYCVTMAGSGNTTYLLTTSALHMGSSICFITPDIKLIQLNLLFDIFVMFGYQNSSWPGQISTCPTEMNTTLAGCFGLKFNVATGVNVGTVLVLP